MATVLKLADNAIKYAPNCPLDRYDLAAIAWVESGFRTDAVGDGGKALGLMQFHKAAWYDVTRKHFGHNVALEQRANPKFAMDGAARYAALTPCYEDKDGGEYRRIRAINHHNVGNFTKWNMKYVRAVLKHSERIRNEQK